MRDTVSAADLGRLRFAGQNARNAALQNIAVILSTPKGSVPLYRQFGLDWKSLDKPISQAKVLMVAEVREAIERWEPRATVLNVSFSEDPARPGALIPTVEVELDID